jgi:lipopolysaccharide/colanic/teichoic acid biosynthesis glycosyltransferase
MRRDMRRRVIKRAFDLVIASIALLLLSPIFVVVALIILVDSRGPVFFVQRRVGRGGRMFRMVKFRTMRVGAEQATGNVSPAGDARVTRVGRVLRSWYLDELPQLANVVRGDMSLVGPRPETPEFVALLGPDERRVLDVLPGVAGPSTLRFMNEAELLADADDPESYYRTSLLHERNRADMTYLDKQSLSYDIGLLFRQVLAIVRRA